MELPVWCDKMYDVNGQWVQNKFHLFTFILNNTWQLMDDTTECIICQVKEESERPWDRYLLPCGHRCFHTRCFRHYCMTVDKFRCPLCGYLKRIRKTKKLKEQLMSKEYMIK